MKSELKQVWMSLVIIIGGLLAFEATHSAKYWQSERITITGEQIAKRLENTRYGGRFYLLMDTQYGVMDIPVSYSLYIQSSNDEVHSLRIKLLTANNALEDTHKLEQAYPFLQHFGLHIAVWVLGVILGIFTLAASLTFIQYCTDKYAVYNPKEDWVWVGFILFNILMAVLGLVL